MGTVPHWIQAAISMPAHMRISGVMIASRMPPSMPFSTSLYGMCR